MDILTGIYENILYSSILASFIAIIIMLLKFIFKNRLNANWHYYIWFIVVLRLVLPNLPDSNLSIFNLVNNPKVNNIVENTFSETSIIKDTTTLNTSENLVTDLSQKDITITNFSSAEQSFTATASIIWLLGFVTILSITLLSYIIFLFKVKKYEKIHSSRLEFILDECTNNLNLKKKIKIYYSDLVNTPTVLGFIGEKILIPTHLEHDLSKDEITHIITHELCHIKRHDIGINFIMMILQCLHWFNPIIWITFNKIKSDCEITCDELVLRNINKENVKNYGETIIKLASLIKVSKPLRLNLAAVDKKNVKRRIIMISKFKKKSIIITFVSVILIVIAGIACLTNPKDNSDSIIGDSAPDTETVTADDTENSEEADVPEEKPVVETPATEENKPVIQNTNNNTTSTNQSNTQNKNESSSTQSKDIVYKSKKFNLSFTIPASWKDKYVVREYEDSIEINYKLKNPPSPDYTERRIIGIGDKSQRPEGDYFLEYFPNCPREVTVNGKTYAVGGPTDTLDPRVDKDFYDYKALHDEAYKVINSIR